MRVDQKKSIKEEMRKLSAVFKKTWRLQICILYTLTVTITVFPGLQLGIEPQVCYDSGVNISSPPPAPLLSSLETKHLPPSQSCAVFVPDNPKPDFPIPLYYADILVFLVSNTGAMLWNFVSLKLKHPGPRRIWIFVVLRTVFVPFIMFCNYKPHARRTPVVFHHDAFHGVASALVGFSNGHLLTLLMEQVAQKSIDEDLNVGMAMVLGTVMILTGVLLGVLFGLMVAKLATI